MKKPQQNPMNDDIFIVSDYPKAMTFLETSLREKLDEVSMEEVEDIVLFAYKAGFIDGWKQALFFTET